MCLREQHQEHPWSCVVLAEGSGGVHGKPGSFCCQIFLLVTFATLCGTSNVPTATSGDRVVTSAQFPSQGPSGAADSINALIYIEIIAVMH